MKTLIASAVLVLISALTLAAEPANVEPPKITVTGEALVYATPDKVVLNFGIETRDVQLVAAKRKNLEIWQKASATLKENGVPEKDIQTDYISIEPRYKDYNQVDNPIGYAARYTFVVTIADPAKVESLISQMLDVGVNHVNGVEFQTTDFKKHRETARELAIKAAKEKAQKMAAVLGQGVGKPVAISETYSGGSWYYSSWSGWGFGRSGGMAQNAIQDSRGPSGEEPQGMALGKISIRAAVSVSFEMKDLPGESKKP